MLISPSLVDTDTVVNVQLPCGHFLYGLHRLAQQLVYNLPYPRLEAEPIQLRLRWVQLLHLILQLHVLSRRGTRISRSCWLVAGATGATVSTLLSTSLLTCRFLQHFSNSKNKMS